MTNNAINNVPRELLCELRDAANDGMNATTRQHQIDYFAGLIAKADALLSAPSPAGVDGLEVVGWYRMDGRKDITPYPSVCATWHKMGVKVGAAYSDSAQAIIDGLRGEVGAQRVNTCEERDAAATECERLRMQLAACGVVALANTTESAGEARQMHPDYMSASCSDVAGAVDREIALRTERDQQAQRIGELEGLLRHAQKQVPTGSGLHMRIDAALSAVCAAAPNIATTSEHSSQPERDPCPMCIKGRICN